MRAMNKRLHDKAKKMCYNGIIEKEQEVLSDTRDLALWVLAIVKREGGHRGLYLNTSTNAHTGGRAHAGKINGK